MPNSYGYYSGCTCLSGYFLGSSRTYYWLATEFEDWCKSSPDTREMIPDGKEICTSTRASYSICDVTQDVGGNEQYYTYYYHYLMTKEITSCGPFTTPPCNHLVNWRDPIPDLAANCGPLACYPCFIGSINCGPKSDIVGYFKDRIEEYYGYPSKSAQGSALDLDIIFDENGDLVPLARNRRVIGSSTDPYPYEGFVYDLFGIVGQGPSSILGQSQFLCNWCGGGFGPPCVDEWFVWRGFTSTVFTWDITMGIPYWHPGKIKKFYRENPIDSLDIRSNHMADEQVFLTGAAHWNYGDITLKGSLLYGDIIPRDPSGSQIIGFDNRLATITNGSGKNSYTIGVGGIGINGGIFQFKDISVLSKDCGSRPGIEEYPWLFVDIPESMNVEYQDGFWTEVQAIPSDSLFTRALYGLSAWDFYGVGIKVPTIGGSHHYRKYVQKIIKTPHNLYIKSGEYTFRECKFGENLKNLEAGRYYFPNMCYKCIGSPSLGIYDPRRYYKSTVNDYQTDTSDADFVKKYGGLTLIQFVNESGATDLQSKFINATGLLGLPWGSGVRTAKMEDVPMYAQFKSVDQYIEEVRQLFDFVLSINSPGGPNFDLLPKPSTPD